MFYQVRANLYFHSQDEGLDFYHDCELALLKASVLNPCTPEQEVSVIELIQCEHDEIPHIPCTLLNKEDNAPVCP